MIMLRHLEKFVLANDQLERNEKLIGSTKRRYTSRKSLHLFFFYLPLFFFWWREREEGRIERSPLVSISHFISIFFPFLPSSFLEMRKSKVISHSTNERGLTHRTLWNNKDSLRNCLSRGGKMRWEKEKIKSHKYLHVTVKRIRSVITLVSFPVLSSPYDIRNVTCCNTLL